MLLPKRVLLLLILSVLSRSAWPQSDAKPKATVKYAHLLYLPKTYASGRDAYPLVIYLHGGSQRGKGGPDLNKLKQYGLPRLVDQGREFPFIIASPQCPDQRYWSSENWFEPLYTALTAKYRIDPKRVYLTGISMGGYGTWQTAVAHPTTFAAIVPLCGGCDDSTQVCRLKNVPIWTFHGTADDLVPVDETARLVRRLRACGGNVRFSRLEQEGHGLQYLYEDPALYEWLLKQHR